MGRESKGARRDGASQAPAQWQAQSRDSRRGYSPHIPSTSAKNPVVEHPAPLQCGSSGRRAQGQFQLPPSLQISRDPRSPTRVSSREGCECISPGNKGARPSQAGWCHRGENRGSTATSAAPRWERRPRPGHGLPASRTILSFYACVPPPPTQQGRPRRGGDERPARCASAGHAKNNCGVLATALPLAGQARRRLRIGALPQPVSRRGCARWALPGAARGLPGDVVTGAAAACPVPDAHPAPRAFASSGRARDYRLILGNDSHSDG